MIKLQSADKLKLPYLKAMLYGETGSGKTTFAANIAAGLVQKYKLDKPVFFFDTEESAKPAYDRFFKPNGIKMEFLASRSLQDLKEFIDTAQEMGSIAIVDSISHVWSFTMKNYLDKKNKVRKENGWNLQKRLYMNDWLEIKPLWVECFDDPYLQSKIHIIQCSRSKNLFDESLEDDSNKNSKTLIHVGTAPRTETNSAYEPYLMIEMIKQVNPKFQDSPSKNKKFIRYAVVVKDKFHDLDGRELPDPQFKSILPHIDKLDIGDKKIESDLSGSDGLFRDDQGVWEALQKKKKICLESIKNGLVEIFPGTGEKEKQKKLTILKALSGSSSWEKWETFNIDQLKFYQTVVDEMTSLYSVYVDIKENVSVPSEEQKIVLTFFDFKNTNELAKSVKKLASELRSIVLEAK